MTADRDLIGSLGICHLEGEEVLNKVILKLPSYFDTL